ncbi:MAG: hypothetical protein ACFFAH_10690 [Promethearchaeota archaeon]
MEKKFKIIGIISIILVSTISVVGFFIIYEDISNEASIEPSDNEEKGFRRFIIGDHNFSSISWGKVNNTYFNLTIGYQIILEGEEEGDHIKVVITVLNRTENVSGIETRVVEEREFEDGEIIEISYNYIAICNETNDIIYFGEAVDNYEGGVFKSHEGAWRADTPDNEPGILMPGMFILSDRYYQEYAPEDALDRAENIGSGITFSTPLGIKSDCILTKESTPLEPTILEYKAYAPGIGIIADENLVITSEGIVSV